MKSNDHRFSTCIRSFRLQIINYLFVAQVNPVKSTDGDNGIPEFGQVGYVAVYLHN
jgi:hypothetical protein